MRTEQVEAYLKENQRSAASLLAASRVTKDQALLQEAMEKYPHDPQVSFAALFKKDANRWRISSNPVAFENCCDYVVQLSDSHDWPDILVAVVAPRGARVGQ